MTSKDIHCDPERRHDFILLFDVTDGNPNGDPDAGNLPRVDPETMHGLVTDVCLKRKVRDYINLRKEGQPGFQIYVQHSAVLNEQHSLAYEATGNNPTKSPKDEVKHAVRAWMCENFYDVRMFGAVMSTRVNCGQVRGPLQMTFGRSFDPIVPLDISITRVAGTKEAKSTEMGRKSIVPYGLYKAHGFFSTKFAKDTGVSPVDLGLFWDALQMMWEQDRSAARGMMACRGLYIFSHEHRLGNAPAHRLFELLEVGQKEEVETPRQFHHYEVSLDDASLPDGVSLTSFA